MEYMKFRLFARYFSCKSHTHAFHYFLFSCSNKQSVEFDFYPVLNSNLRVLYRFTVWLHHNTPRHATPNNHPSHLFFYFWWIIQRFVEPVFIFMWFLWWNTEVGRHSSNFLTNSQNNSMLCINRIEMLKNWRNL